MISFIDEHRSRLGVEPICRLLPIAPSTYYEGVAKRTDVDRLSARARSDIAMKVEIRRVFNEHFQVYGVRKVWRQLQREGFDVARCTVARLMKMMGLHGVIRGKPVKTTVSDKASPCPLDRVNRQFFAPAPNMLWLSDFTYGHLARLRLRGLRHRCLRSKDRRLAGKPDGPRGFRARCPRPGAT
jgi:putative transposase